MMGNKYFQIVEGSAGQHICATLNGFWDIEVLKHFDREARRVVTEVTQRSPGCGLTVLIDARESVTQSQDVATGFQALSASLGKNIRKTAVLVSSTIHKMQAERINPSSNHRIFHEEKEALSWLAKEEPDLA